MRGDDLLLAADCLFAQRGGCDAQGGPSDGPRTPKRVASARPRGAEQIMILIGPYSVALAHLGDAGAGGIRD